MREVAQTIGAGPRVLSSIRRFIDAHQESLGLLLGISGLIGAIWGLATATYQAPIEAAQVMSGLVRYDPASPIYTMHISLFTIVNYFLALLIALTNSEVTASLILCAVIGMVAMQALSMAVFLGVRNVYLSVIAAVCIVRLHLFGYGIAYPIYFVGTAHANGRIGLFFAVLAVLLFAVERFRSAFFLCGLTLLVHPSWGIFVGLCLALVLATGYKYLRPLVNRPNIAAYFGGVGISLAAVGIHKLLYPLPRETGVDLAAARKLFSAYIRNWDYHRQRFADPGTLIRELTYAAIALIIAIFLFRRRYSTLGEKLFAHFLMVASVLGAVFVFIPAWFSPDAFPEMLIALMPGRFINIALFLALPILIGLLLRERRTLVSLAAVGFVWLVLLYLLRFNPFTVRIGEYEFSLMLTAIVFIILHRLNRAIPGGNSSTYGATNLFLAAGTLALIAYSPIFLLKQLPTVRTEFTAIAVPPVKGQVLTTIENYMLPTKARVPTISPLLDGYPHTGAGTLLAVQREMRDIYGIDLGQDPPHARGLHRGVLVTADYNYLWESRECADWERLARQYGIALVITPPDLELRLPRADNDPAWNKYYPRCPG